MIIYDNQWNAIENPDLEAGKIENKYRPVIHKWIIDVEEVAKEVVVAEYPNGGKDVEYVVEVPEEGHWETYLEDGTPINFDGNIPDDLPHEQPVSDYENYGLYIRYTKEELDKIVKAKQEAEQQAKKRAEQAKFLDSAPSRVNVAESNINDAQDALAELGTLVANNATTLEDVLNAVAELGVIVTEKETN